MTLSGWAVVFAADAIHDLSLIEDHLGSAYQGFGEPPEDAQRHAEARIDSIIATAERLPAAPLRGEPHDDLLPGLRHLTLDGAVYWFIPDAEVQVIRVLAIFVGGQDHQRHMLVRLLQRGAR